MRYLFLIMFSFITLKTNAQIQFGLGCGFTRLESNFKVYEMGSENLLLSKKQAGFYPSYFCDIHLKNFGAVVSASNNIYGLSMDYSKLVIDDVLSCGLGIGMNFCNWDDIKTDYFTNNQSQYHEAPLNSDYRTAAGVISANCDVRLYRNFKGRISLMKPLGNIGYSSNSNSVRTIENRWVGLTTYSKNPMLTFSIYYSFEEKLKGPLIIDPKPARKLKID